MTRLFNWLAALALAAFASTALADNHTKNVLGKWWNQEKTAQIEMYDKDGKIFGKIVWLRPERLEALDDKNPDEKLRARKLMGLDVFQNFAFNGKDEWEGGTAYKADEGKNYKAKMWMEGADTLMVRGYIGIPALGKTNKMERVKS